MAQVDFETLLKETIGLDSASVGSSTVDRAVRLRMAGAGIASLEDYWRQVRSSAQELQELIETVVVPETWFFRDREAFAVLVRLAVEEWLPAHGAATFRALSVPCSTGEEPYSMVMALLDGGFSRERVQVDAVDISARALARAKQGEYGPNSFRGEDLDFRERYFSQTARGYSVARWLRDMVTFRQGNLLLPESSFGHELYDVIFCRNLLIYFDRSTQERIMRTLGSLLSPTGFLFVGGAETYLASRSGFTSVNQAMSFGFRKIGVRSTEPGDSPVPPLLRLPRLPPPVVRTIGLRPVHPVDGLVPAVPFRRAQPPPHGLETARRLADSGRLREAAEWCENDIRQQISSADTWYLLGLVRDALGDARRAAECYRKVLYLDPEHLEALTHLALLTETEGDTAAAGRLRQRVRRIGLRAERKIS
jgi:chemotaxis protein methyltransferase WspC